MRSRSRLTKRLLATVVSMQCSVGRRVSTLPASTHQQQSQAREQNPAIILYLSSRRQALFHLSFTTNSAGINVWLYYRDCTLRKIDAPHRSASPAWVSPGVRKQKRWGTPHQHPSSWNHGAANSRRKDLHEKSAAAPTRHRQHPHLYEPPEGSESQRRRCYNSSKVIMKKNQRRIWRKKNRSLRKRSPRNQANASDTKQRKVKFQVLRKRVIVQRSHEPLRVNGCRLPSSRTIPARHTLYHRHGSTNTNSLSTTTRSTKTLKFPKTSIMRNSRAGCAIKRKAVKKVNSAPSRSKNLISSGSTGRMFEKRENGQASKTSAKNSKPSRRSSST